MLRAAQPDDAHVIAELHRLGWLGHRELIGASAPAESDQTAEARALRWRSQLRPGAATTVMVDDLDGEVRGFISLGPSADDDGRWPGADEIWDLWVHPRHQRAGIGAGLLGWALTQAHRPCVVWVVNENTDGLRFYQREGARWDGTMRTENLDGADGQVAELTLLRLVWMPLG